MAKIGTFNRIDPGKLPERTAVRDTIDVDGVDIELKHVQDVPGYPMAEFARLITTPTPAKDYLTQAIVQGVIEACLTDEGLAIFRSASLGLLPSQIVEVTFALYQWWASVPFEQHPESLDGRTPMSGKHSESSPSTSQDSEQPDSSGKSADQLRLEAVILGGS